MSEAQWFRSHVERCLQDAFDDPRLDAEGNGSYPFRSDTASCGVTIVSGADGFRFALVRARAVVEIKRSAKLLIELNDINSSSISTHVYWADDAVIVEQAVVAEAVSIDSMYQACLAVGELADNLGLLVASAFGGRTPHNAMDQVEEAAD